jgi:Protein of unknown function (DUF732)
MALMAKQVRRPSDPTVAASLDGGRTVAAPLDGGYTVAAPIDGGQTTAVPNTRPTDKVELAWSTGDVLGGEESPDLKAVRDEKPQSRVESQSWGATVRIASLLVAGCLVLAGAIVLGRWALTGSNSPSKAVPSQGATSATSAAPTTIDDPSSITSTPAQDSNYIQALNEKGITFDKPENAIYNGKAVCRDLSKSVSRPEIVNALRAKAPFLGDKVYDYVNISISAYCPQYAAH